MSIRHWFFRIPYLSLSLLITQSSINAADIPTMGRCVVQALQVAGMGAAAFYRACGGNKATGTPHMASDPHPSSMTGVASAKTVVGPVAGMPMPTVSPVTTTAEQTKTYASGAKTHVASRSSDTLSPHIMGTESEIAEAFKNTVHTWKDSSLDNNIASKEKEVAYFKHQKGFISQDQADRSWEVVQQLKQANINIAQLEAQLSICKAEKASRLSQKATTTAASTAVLITQTAPATESNEPMIKAKEDKPPLPHRRNDGPESKKDMNDNEPPHEAKSPQLDFNDKPGQGHGAHPWRQAPGHYGQKTVEAVEEVQNAITKGTFRGVKDGKFQYDWTCPETGKQVWVETIGNKVQNCGFNLEPWSVGENGFLVRPDLAGPSTRLLKGVTVVGTGSVIFSSEYLAQTQEDTQIEARKSALENRFEDIIDPYGIKKLSDSTTSNLMKADSNGRIDYNDVTRKLVSTLEPKTSEVRKIMDDLVKKSKTPPSTPSTSPYKSASPYASMKTDKASLNKAMSSKPSREYKHKFISEKHKKAYMNSMKPKWTKKKD